MANADALQRDARARQAVARVQAQGFFIVGFAPLNQRRQHAAKQTLAILTHGNLPLQHTLIGVAAGQQRWATVNLQRAKSSACSLYIRGVGHKVHQARLHRYGGLQRCVVHIKPAFGA